MCIYDCMWNPTVRLLINRFLSYLTAFPTCDFGDLPHSLRCDDLPRSMNTRDPSLDHVPNLGWIVCVAFYEFSVKAEEPLDLGLVEADGAIVDVYSFRKPITSEVLGLQALHDQCN